MKFSDYQQITRSKTSLVPISDLSAISLMAKTLFEAIELGDVSRQAAPRLRGIRLLGISLSNLGSVKEAQIVQLPLF